MLISICGELFLFLGLLILVLPIILVELSRPRDWLLGGLYLFLGLFLLVENDLLRGSINLLIICMVILYAKMMMEIIQNRWFQLSLEEKKRIGSFERWFESFKQLGEILKLLGNTFLNNFKSFSTLSTQSEKPIKEKKWVRSELKEDIKMQAVDKSD